MDTIPPSMHARTLYKGQIVSVIDVSCGSPAGPCGAEERAAGNHLVFVRRGVWTKHSGAGMRQTLVAEPLHALFLNEHEPYAVSHPVSGGDECTVLEFSSAHAQQVALSFDARHIDRGPGPFAISRAPLAPHAFYRLHALRRFARDERATPLAIEEEALGLLAGALRDGYSAVGRHSSVKREDTARHRRDLIEHAKVTLAGSPGARWSLAQLAREVHSSPFHLTRVFNEIVGVPVHRYLLQLRLSLALDYIDGGSRQLSAIALQLGFANHSHLSASFRRVFGASPGSFRAGGLRHARNFLTAPRELSSLACGLPERRTEERDARHTSGEVG